MQDRIYRKFPTVVCLLELAVSLIPYFFMELLRDTIFGHALRLVSGGKILPYAEDRDPSLWKRYVHKEKTAYMAHHGSAGPQEGDGSGDDSNSPHDSQTAFRTVTGASSHSEDVPRNALGHRVDQEKGKDTSVVDWYGENDPEVQFTSSVRIEPGLIQAAASHELVTA